MRWCHMRGGNNSKHNLVSKVVTINLNVLRTLMTTRIVSNEDSSLIMIMNGHWRGRRDAEIFEKWSKPYHLRCSLNHSPILWLCTRPWYHLLFPPSPGDEVTSNICAITCSSFMISLITCIPSIRVGFDTEISISLIDEPYSWGSFDIC